jgi:Domain of unknown function (DUF6475)
MTRKEFGEIMAFLQAGSGTGDPATKLQLKVYWDFLKEIDYETAKRAAKLALSESKFPTIPPVGVLLELCNAAPQKITSEDRAIAAYNVASLAVKTYGMYRSVDFDDPLANAAIRQMGGWEKWCSWPPDEVQWRKRDFAQNYLADLATGVSGELCRPLAGICEADNGEAWHIHKIEVGLPQHRPGLVRGEIPAGIEAEVVQQTVKRIASCFRSVEEPPQEKPVAEPLTDAEFRDRREDVIRRLKSDFPSGATS